MTSGQPTEPVPEQPGRAQELGGRSRLRFRVGIQSKLLVTLLVCSILSVAVVGLIGYLSGRTALRDMASERLVELRESQKRQVEAMFARLTDSIDVYSSGFSAVQALGAFAEGFAQLANATISPAQQQSIVNYYNGQLIKPIQRITGDEIDLNALLPASNAQKYLQAYYTAPFASASDSMMLNDAGDGSGWSATNARYNFYFRSIVTRFGYRDALLLDMQGNVVYTVAKGPDLGTNILTGPYRETNLRDAYQKALRANDLDFVWITDFQPYQPQLDAPTAWVVSPIGMEGKIGGVMAVPVPISSINNITTADKHWEAAGVGRSTEAYLAGQDSLMRSDSRLFLEDPEAYRRETVGAGTPPDVVNKAIRLGGTTLVQPVPSAALRAAQRGQTGVLTENDYLGNKALVAYTPLNVPNSDLHWSILATREYSEAFARLAAFGKTLILAVAAMIFIVCVASMLLAQVMLRPIRKLEAGTQKISSGNYDITIPVTSHDEIGDLTAAFNEMSRNLSIKEELLNEQRRENDRLLRSLMPEPVLQRYRDGEEIIAEQHQNVSIIYADIVGLDEISNDVSGDELVGIVDDLFRQFDSAAESLGVERIRTFHNGYLASCGVTTPRLDNIHRSVDFTLEMQRIIDRFNSRTRHELRLRVGVNTGNVISGLVGRSGLVYDMWGAAVSLAHQMHSGSPQPGIYVSSRVYEAMRDIWKFTPAGSISVSGSEQRIWRLSERQ